MYKKIFKVFLILVLIVLQYAIFNKFVFFDAVPNLVLILAIALALKGNLYDSALVAFMGGFLFDLASPLRFGAFTVLFLIIIFLIYFVLLKSMPSPNYFFIFLIFIGGFLIYNLGNSLYTLSFSFYKILAEVLINGAIGVFVYVGLGKLIKSSEEVKLIG